jgi:IS5 family transposase
LVSAANVHDMKRALPLIDAISPVHTGRRGRPRRRPKKAHGDKGYDYAVIRRGLRARSILPRIARKGVESSTKLGQHRWVVERTLSWLHHFKRLRIREERRADLHLAFLQLGCCVVLQRRLPSRL